MPQNKASAKFARKLVALSKDDQGLVSAGKVGEVLDALRKHPPRNAHAVLRDYRRLVTRELALGTAAITTASPLDPAEIASLEAYFSKRYDRTIQAVQSTDISLLAGFKAQVGDDLYDASAAGRLARLAAGVR